MATIMETTNDVCLMLIGCFVVSVSGIQFEFDCNSLLFIIPIRWEVDTASKKLRGSKKKTLTDKSK